MIDGSLITTSERLLRNNVPFVWVTVVSTEGSAPREIGAKMLVTESGRAAGTVGGGNLEERAIEEALVTLKDGITRTVEIALGAVTGQCCGGRVGLLFEAFSREPDLYLFGAGHVAQEIARVFENTPFRLTVIDERAEWLEALPVQPKLTRFDGDWETFVEKAAWSEKATFAVILTHRHDLDQSILEAVLKKPARFVGLIGSDTKRERFFARLGQRGFSPAELERVQCPIGDPELGKTPRAIAVGLAAQLLKIHAAFK